jgi:hypothetical protein
LQPRKQLARKARKSIGRSIKILLQSLEIISESEQELQESQHDEIGDCIVVEYC